MISRSRTKVLTTAMAAVVALGLAGQALAQGLYYKEMARDGRIYVFNIAANAERFEKTGEMGAAITMPGAGPNGETVIGDNEKALQLFFFKHNIPTLVPDPPPPPPSPPPFRISGLVFGDYYYFASDHLSAWESQQGFWLRRAYFTYDHTISPALTARFRLEVNSNGKLAGGLLTPYVKDAYLAWTYHGRQKVTLGIQPSLTFEFIESVWGLRHIEKPPVDLYRWDASRETGVTFSGPINEAQTLKYAFQFGNEAGNTAETDKFKGYRFASRYEANPGFTVEGMVGQFERDKNADRATAQIFAAYRTKKGRIGFQYSFQRRRAADGTTASDTNLDLVSGFGVLDLKPQKLTIFARVDRVADACADCAGIDYLPIDSKGPFTMTLAGLEYYIHPSVRFSPNVEWVAYDAPATGTAPKDDVVLRMTFYWGW